MMLREGQRTYPATNAKLLLFSASRKPTDSNDAASIDKPRTASFQIVLGAYRSAATGPSSKRQKLACKKTASARRTLSSEYVSVEYSLSTSWDF